MKKLKILVWCPFVNLGGGERLLIRLVEAMAKNPSVDGIKLAIPRGSIKEGSIKGNSNIETVWLKIMKPKLPTVEWLKPRTRLFSMWGIGTIVVTLYRFYKMIYSQDRYYRKALLDSSSSCDLVYIFWPHRLEFPIIDKPVVCTIQDLIFFDFPEHLLNETKTEWNLINNWLTNCAGIVVSSKATMDAIKRHFGNNETKINVIRHAIPPLGEGNDELNVPGLSSDNYFVLPSNIASHKNHHTLLTAWSRFSRRAQYPLVMFGYGTEMLNRTGPDWPQNFQAATLAGLIARKGMKLGSELFALGFVKNQNVLPLIRNAKALIMPTLAEGGGSFPVEEALSAGIPVLCSDIPVLREQLVNRSAKIAWFDPESPESIVSALNDILDNYKEYKESALLAKNNVLPSWENVADQYVKYFQDIISKSDKTE